MAETKEYKTFMTVSEKCGTETPEYKKAQDDYIKKFKTLKSYERANELSDEVAKASLEYSKRHNESKKEYEKTTEE
jgi:hypothetical protein